MNSECLHASPVQEPRRGLSKFNSERLWAVFLGAIGLIYVWSSLGVVCSNDGAHFATVRSLVRHGTPALGEGAVFAQNDVCTDIGGRLHANRPLGTAVALVPAYLLGMAFPAEWFAPLETVERRWLEAVEFPAARLLGHVDRLDAFMKLQRAERPMQILCAAWLGAIGVLSLYLLWQISRRLGIGRLGAGLCVASVGLGTVHWRYSTACFSHVPSQTCLLWSLAALLGGSGSRSTARAFAFGAVAGLSVLIEYQSLLTLPILAIWFLASLSAADRRSSRITLSATVGLCIFLAFIGMDHALRFGGPFNTPMSTSVHFDYAARLSTMFGANPLRGAYTLYFSRYTNGLCWVSWCAAIAGLGWLSLAAMACRNCTSARWRDVPAPRSHGMAIPRSMAWMAIAATIAVHSITMFFIETPYGGATADHRYLVRVLPLIILPFGVVVDGIWRRIRMLRGGLRTLAILVGATCLLLILGHDVAQMIRLQAEFMKHRAWLEATWIDFANPPPSSWTQMVRATFVGFQGPPWIGVGFAFLMPLLSLLFSQSADGTLPPDRFDDRADF